MGKIRILDSQLANQIAAGEVVERPASVVKELVENALDAGATRILTRIEEGGTRLIAVSDNGSGMDREDVELAFSRHATSKIRRERDLFAIQSLGFRGEALPSIASVSRLTLTTAEKGGGPATQAELEGGEWVSIKETARSPGTDVVVRDLFYNTPARLKYLKTVNTEVSHVADLIGRLALAHPDVSFLLEHNQREIFRTAGDGKLLHGIFALYGKRVASKMIPLAEEDMDFRISGYVGRPEVLRSNRSYISTIINGRFVRSLPLTQAVIRGYDTLLPVGRFPIAVLLIEMDPKLVDVNVHPAKLEVRLSKERELVSLVEQSIRELFQKQVLIPKVESPVSQRQPRVRPVQQRLDLEQGVTKTPKNIVLPRTTSPEYIKEERAVFTEKRPVLRQEQPRGKILKVEPPEKAPEVTPRPRESREHPQEIETTKESFPEMSPLTQIHGTYIVAQGEDGFYLIDQHAAHERIYYEIFREEFGKKTEDRQTLLLPLSIECTAAEAAVVKEHLDQLEHLGLELEPFGGTTFLLRSHPRWIPEESIESVVQEIIGWLMQRGRVKTEELRDEGAKMMSCKAAIKANRFLRQEEMEHLIKQLKVCQSPFTCPHGRPVLIHFSTREIEKMFKRVM